MVALFLDNNIADVRARDCSGKPASFILTSCMGCRKTHFGSEFLNQALLLTRPLPCWCHGETARPSYLFYSSEPNEASIRWMADFQETSYVRAQQRPQDQPAFGAAPFERLLRQRVISVSPLAGRKRASPGSFRCAVYFRDILPSLKGGASQATHGIPSPTLALEGTVRARCRIT